MTLVLTLALIPFGAFFAVYRQSEPAAILLGLAAVLLIIDQFKVSHP